MHQKFQDAPLFRGLIEHPNVICTPHMGTSPLQGHQRIANEIAENIVSLNSSTGPYGAVSCNLSLVSVAIV